MQWLHCYMIIKIIYLYLFIDLTLKDDRNSLLPFYINKSQPPSESNTSNFNRVISLRVVWYSFLLSLSALFFSSCFLASVARMPAGAISNGLPGKEYPGKFTFFVFITSIVAGMGGLVFVYDIGISSIYIVCFPRKRKETIFKLWVWRLFMLFFFSYQVELRLWIPSFWSFFRRCIGRKI